MLRLALLALTTQAAKISQITTYTTTRDQSLAQAQSKSMEMQTKLVEPFMGSSFLAQVKAQAPAIDNGKVKEVFKILDINTFGADANGYMTHM